ncbi:hypothetical protein PLICRDRAFT_174308 [Plicaturopsis crispa FD-325 SS-3]|nr:hypothetical protein PLICRDRAFT_174308 [Plicaturopsis crispa FD-325 SS-3]
MASTFVAHHTRALTLLSFPSSRSLDVRSIDNRPSNTSLPTNDAKDVLRSLAVSLQPPLTGTRVRDALTTLASLKRDVRTSALDSEDEELRRTVLGKLVIGLYAEALDTYLAEASEADAEAEWWADVERSRQNVAWYLLQTLPARLLNLARTVLHQLRTNHIPIRPSLFTPSSLRRLFPSTDDLRPNALTVSLFPHLHGQPHILSLSLRVDPSTFSLVSSSSGIASVVRTTTNSTCVWARSIVAFALLPLELTRQECQFKQQELEKIRDERAETLGTLTEMRDNLAAALEDGPSASADSDKLALFVQELTRAAGQSSPETDIFSAVQQYADSALQLHTTRHAAHITTHALHRPTWLTQAWPRLLVLPPLTLYGLAKLSASRASLEELGRETYHTAIAFVRDWLFEPMKDVVNTVRAGSKDGGMLVSKEGVAADVDSLERMTLSLARDKLNFSQTQLEELSRQIRVGDLTAVLQIYEEDIKTPFKSVVAGSLLRSAFIQIQKTKVDLDQALEGIDKLLKSQELTFAFVGVAPAFAVLYVLGGYLRSLWRSGAGSGKYGGKRQRHAVWLSIRRIERLLISQPKTPRKQIQDEHKRAGSIPPLTTGLLLLSLANLRTYAETCLPPRSRLRQGFLADVEDLEDPVLGRTEKLRVVDRMWKSWGEVLGWGRIAAERK